jgi:glyoxylase-like metal-dependent hydrolase (beta-lactamase superfamily II)
MTDPVRIAVGDVQLTRAEYFDIALGPEVVNLSSAEVVALPGSTPVWATDDGDVNIGQAMWVVESAGTTIVVDPCGASDAFLRTGPEAIVHQEAMLAALAGAGFAAADVDLVVLTHLDGIGLAGVVDEAGAWSPAFPDARIIVNGQELAFLTSPAAEGTPGLGPFLELVAAGAVDAVADDHPVAPGVRLVHTGGHSVGHSVVRVESGDDLAVLIGHLAVSPLNLAAPISPASHVDAAVAGAVIDGLLAEAAATGGVLIGPLWPSPGAGHVAGTSPRSIVPIQI